jgi:type I restriction enzyme M protein
MSHNISGVIKSIRDIMREDRGVSGDGQRIEQLAWMLFLKIFDDNDKDLELRNDKYKSPIPKKYQWRHWAENTEGMTGDELSKFIDQELFPALREIRPATKRAYLVREAFEGNNNYMKSGTNIRKVLNKLDELDFNVATERHLFGEMYETILRELQNAGDYGEFYTPRAVTQFMTDMVNPKLGEVVFDPACGTGGFLTCTIEHLKKQIKNVSDRRILQENVRGNEYKPLPYLLAITNLLLHDIEEPDITYIDSLGRELTSYKEKDRVDIILANPPFGATVSNNNEKNFPQTYRTKESADLFLILFVHLLKDGGRAAIVLPDGSLTGEGIKQRVREKLLTDCNLHTIIRLPNSVFQPYATVATNLLFFTKVGGAHPERSEGAKRFATKEVWYYQHRLPEGQKAYNKTRPIQLKEFDPIKKWWKKREESEICWKVSIDTIKERGFDLDIKNPTATEEEIEHTSSELTEKLKASFQKSLTLLHDLEKNRK